MNTPTLEQPVSQATEAEEPRNLYTNEDGMICDADTGEILQVAGSEDDQAVIDGKPIDEEYVSKVMRRMLRHDSRIRSAELHRADAQERLAQLEQAALEALGQTPEHIEASAELASAEKVLNYHTRAATMLRLAYSDWLGRFAKMALGLGKRRTWDGMFGSISIRRKPARVIIADPDAFCSAALQRGWTKAYKVVPQVSGIPDAEVEGILAAYEQDPELGEFAEMGLSVEPPTETVTITTGVKGDKK